MSPRASDDLAAMLEEIKVLANAETAALMLDVYRGAIDTIRRAIPLGASHDADNWQTFLETISRIADAVEPMETAYWDDEP